MMRGQLYHMAANFDVSVDEDQSKLPTLYWLPKHHKRPYKSCFIAKSSYYTTTHLSIILCLCLNAGKNHAIKFVKQFLNLFLLIVNKLKSKQKYASIYSVYIRFQYSQVYYNTS